MVARSAVSLLVAGMLITGISNSLFTKWQDMQCVARCDQDPSKQVEFSQPVWQTLQMFLGECLCLVPIFIRFLHESLTRPTPISKSGISNGGQYQALGQSPTTSPRVSTEQETVGRGAEATNGYANGVESGHLEGETLSGAAVGLFFAPALCDICGTTLMNVGLLFTPVSIYQMTRGALVLWVGVFSVIFLRRHLFLFQWLSLVTVMLGVCVVGLSGTIFKSPTEQIDAFSDPFVIHSTLPLSVSGLPKPDASPLLLREGKKGDEELPETIGALLGVLLILFAQFFTAAQFVLEEKIMARYSVEPLLAVGYEGVFGFGTTLAAQVLLHFTYGRSKDGRGSYFDMVSGWQQMIHSRSILLSSFAIALSIALFNFFGLSVTRNVSATARSTIDTCRTIGIWAVSLALGWEVFRAFSGSLQVLGFVLLCYGTLVFNSVVKPPKCLRPRRPRHFRRSTSRSRSRSRAQRSHSRQRTETTASATTTSTMGNDHQEEEERRRIRSSSEG